MSRKSALLLVSILISSLLMVFVPIHSVAAEPVRVYVDPPNIVDPSTFFNVSVKVDNLTGLAGVQWTLRWDPTVLYAVDLTEVMFHEVVPQSEWDNLQIWRHVVDNVIGKAEYAYAFTDLSRAIDGGYCPISGNHTMAIVVFRVVSMGNCTIHLENVKLGTIEATPIPHDTVDSFFSNSVPPPPNPPSPLPNSQLLLYVSPHRVKNENLIVNSTFSVTVKLDSILNHTGILDVTLDLQWNSTVLECVNITEVMLHDLMPESEWDNIDNSFVVNNTGGILMWHDGFLNYTRGISSGYEPVFGNHTLAIITFRVKDVGRSLLYLSDLRAWDTLAHFMLYTPLNGFFSNMLSGDLNCDNVVNIFDALLFAKSFGTTPEGSSWNEDADINGDGFVDIYDALLLCNRFGHTT